MWSEIIAFTGPHDLYVLSRRIARGSERGLERSFPMNKYRLVAKKGEGTFSEVLKAQSVVTGYFYAVKCMKNHFKSQEQVNNLREIQALRLLHTHENIISLEEVLFDEQSGRLALGPPPLPRRRTCAAPPPQTHMRICTRTYTRACTRTWHAHALMARVLTVFELMDMNIYELIRNRKQYLKPELVKVNSTLASLPHLYAVPRASPLPVLATRIEMAMFRA